MKIAMLVMNDMRADARVDREASALAAAGHDVTALALRASDADVDVSNEESRDGFTIRRVADYTTVGWSRPWTKVSQARGRSSVFAREGIALAAEVVHAHDTDTLVAAARIAAALSARLVYDAHELYADMLQEHGLQGSAPVQAYWRRLERRLVPRADAVITVSDGLAGQLARRFGVKPVVVANVPVLTPVGDRTRLRRELELDASTPVVLYQGVLIPGRGLERLVRAMASVPDAVLVIQGFGPAESGMHEVAVASGLHDRVRFMGRIAPDELHDYASGADLGVVIYEHTTVNNYLAAPNKLYAYLMAGLPVAGSAFPGLSSVIDGEGVGATFDPADQASIGGTIRGLLGNRGELGAMGRRARVAAETRYNWDLEKLKLLEVYERLAAARSTS